MPLDRRTGDEPAPIRNMDSWAGYDAPRERLLRRLGQVGNAVVLTGDEHQNFAGELRTDGGRGTATAVEFVGTSISSGGDGAPHRNGSDRILSENPFLKWSNDQRGYLVCEVTPATWTTRFRTLDRVTVPDRPIATAAVATVEHGQASVNVTAG